MEFSWRPNSRLVGVEMFAQREHAYKPSMIFVSEYFTDGRGGSPCPCGTPGIRSGNPDEQGTKRLSDRSATRPASPQKFQSSASLRHLVAFSFRFPRKNRELP